MLSKTPLRLILIVPFVAQITATVGLTAWLSIRNGQRAVNEIVGQLWEETTARTNAEVNDLLSTTRVVNNLSVKAIQRENLDLQTIRSVEDLYWDYLTTFPKILGVGLGNASGDILGMFRRTEGGKSLYFLEYSSPETGGRYVSLQLNDQGEVVQSKVTDRYIDARERPWYRAAVEAAGPIWSEVYTSVSQVEGHALAINASQPVYAADGQLLGVVSVILDLGQVSQILDAIELSPAGQIYILEANGNLIGSSDGHSPVFVGEEGVDRLPATDSKSPIIRASAAHLNALFEGNFGSITRSLQLNFDLEGERQYLQITPIQASDQLRWYIVVVAPESDFMAQIEANTRNTIWLCLGALALATGSSILTARWITQPLLQLNQAARDITQGSLQSAPFAEVIVTGRTREVSELSHSFHQMTQQLQASFAALQTSEANFRNMAANVPGAIFRYILRPDGTDAVLYMSPGCYQLWEIEAHAVEQDASVLWQVLDPDELSAMQTSVMASAKTLQTWNYEWRITTPSGRHKWLQAKGQPTRQPDGAVLWHAVILDVSERKRAEEQLIYTALHDALTDLPNRTLLSNRLELAIKRAQQSSTYHFAVLFLDLDQFKVINDSLGHLVGDQLLMTVAQKLSHIVRPTDVVARLGGDEFVILLEHIPEIATVIQMAERILAEFEGTTSVDDHSVFITTSIGIVWGTNAYTETSNLLRDADIALYRAKAKGRSRYEIFDVEMHVQAMKRMTLEHDLRVAIDQQEFITYYQPILDLNTQRLIGFEALIRWPHPVRGFISPVDFIPVAEETGLILPISRWMLRSACEQVAAWQRQFPAWEDLRVSVNLSGQDLRQPDLVEMVRQTLRQSGLPATSLTLEITESMLIDNIETTIDLLGQLRDLGIRISIDDFGTGYSSLSYLYNLPANYLKIDRSFVSKMRPGGKNYKIVQAVVSLSDQLQLAAIAEGIETIQQLEWLKELGCELGQGYLLARPLTPEAAATVLSRQT